MAKVTPATTTAEGGWEPPSKDKAIQFRELHHPRLKDENGVTRPYPLSTSPKEFAAMGSGIALYYESLRFLTGLFFLMFLISMPGLLVMVFSSPEDITKTESAIEPLKALTVGNIYYGHDQTNSTSEGDWRGCDPNLNTCRLCVGSVCQEFEEDYVAIAVSALDCLYTIVYLLGVFYLSRRQIKRVNEIDQATLSAADWTVEVRDLPLDVEKAGEVMEYFSKFGDVVNVAIGRSDGAIIRTFHKRHLLEQKRDREVARQQRGSSNAAAVEKLNTQLTQMDAKIERLRSKRANQKSHAAFVTFNDESSYLACLKAFNGGCCSRMCISQNQKFRKKYALKVIRAPEPTDLLWENLEFGTLQRFLRRCITTTLSILILLVSVVIVVAAKSFKEQGTQKANECAVMAGSQRAACHLDTVILTPQQYEPIIADIEAMPPSNASLCAACVCTNLQASAPNLYASSIAVFFPAVYGTDGFCTQHALFFGIQIAAIASIFIINTSVRFLMVKFSHFERHHWLSQREASSAMSIFILQFFNTGLITLLVFSQIDEVKAGLASAASSAASAAESGQDVTEFTRYFPIFAGPYQDLTPKWYAVVGTSIIMTVFLNAFIPMVPVFVTGLKKALAGLRPQPLLQEELNERYLGPELQIAQRYGLVLSTVFVCLLYSSGIPILLLCASVTFGIMYSVEKLLLLRVYRTPPQYNDTIARLMVKCLPYAGIMHMLLGLWIYSARGTFPRPLLSPEIQKYADELLAQAKPGTQEYQLLVTYNIPARLFNWVVFPMFILLLLSAMGLLLPKLMAALCGGLLRSNKVGDGEGLPPYRDALAAHKISGIPNYELTSNRNYKGVFSAKNQQDDVPV